MNNEIQLKERRKLQEDEYVFPYQYLSTVEKWRDMRYESQLRVIKELLKPFAGQTVLDAGCGAGRLCYELRNENVHLAGVDYSDRAIRFAKAFCPEVAFHVGDLADFKAGEQFDCIVLAEVLEHVPPDGIPRVLENIRNLLKDGGKFVISVPTTRIRLLDKHFQHFTPASLEKTLDAHFRIESLTGHLKTGPAKFIYKMIEVFGELLSPLAEKLPPLRAYYALQKRFLQTMVEYSPPHRASRLIAVCRKK